MLKHKKRKIGDENCSGISSPTQEENLLCDELKEMTLERDDAVNQLTIQKQRIAALEAENERLKFELSTITEQLSSGTLPASSQSSNSVTPWTSRFFKPVSSSSTGIAQPSSYSSSAQCLTTFQNNPNLTEEEAILQAKLVKACAEGKIERIKKLVEKKGAVPHLADRDGEQPLAAAIRSFSFLAIDYLEKKVAYTQEDWRQVVNWLKEHGKATYLFNPIECADGMTFNELYELYCSNELSQLFDFKGYRRMCDGRWAYAVMHESKSDKHIIDMDRGIVVEMERRKKKKSDYDCYKEDDVIEYEIQFAIPDNSIPFTTEKRKVSYTLDGSARDQVDQLCRMTNAMHRLLNERGVSLTVTPLAIEMEDTQVDAIHLTDTHIHPDAIEQLTDEQKACKVEVCLQKK